MSYWAHWRAAHPEYRAREAARKRLRRKRMTRAERQRDRGAKPSRAIPKLETLYPELVVGYRLSFWEDELRMDLAQEAELARLEGRDPEEAVKVYRAKERAWKRVTVPLVSGSGSSTG